MICLECTIILWTVGVMNVEMHCHQTGEMVVDKNLVVADDTGTSLMTIHFKFV